MGVSIDLGPGKNVDRDLTGTRWTNVRDSVENDEAMLSGKSLSRCAACSFQRKRRSIVQLENDPLPATTQSSQSCPFFHLNALQA